MTSIQLLSDVHLEHRRQGRWTGLKPLAPYLALCGDIGNPATDAYARFLNEQAQMFEKIFVLAGNHECYGRTVPEAEACIEAACARHPEKLVFMNRRRLDIDDRLSVLGTTLWSKIDADVAQVAAHAISDFRCIRGWTVETNNEAHARDVAWLTESLSDVRREGRRAVVLTHHAPTHRSTSAECYASSPLRSVFATDLEHLVRPPVAAWLYGHTHHSNDQVLNGVRLVANQVGYPGEGVRYDHGCVVDIDPGEVFAEGCSADAI